MSFFKAEEPYKNPKDAENEILMAMIRSMLNMERTHYDLFRRAVTTTVQYEQLGYLFAIKNLRETIEQKYNLRIDVPDLYTEARNSLYPPQMRTNAHP